FASGIQARFGGFRGGGTCGVPETSTEVLGTVVDPEEDPGGEMIMVVTTPGSTSRKRSMRMDMR
ncbi:hypothetical protein HDU93_002707, partial [Gonapodya sp. JEL0774]